MRLMILRRSSSLFLVLLCVTSGASGLAYLDEYSQTYTMGMSMSFMVYPFLGIFLLSFLGVQLGLFLCWTCLESSAENQMESALDEVPPYNPNSSEVPASALADNVNSDHAFKSLTNFGGGVEVEGAENCFATFNKICFIYFGIAFIGIFVVVIFLIIGYSTQGDTGGTLLLLCLLSVPLFIGGIAMNVIYTIFAARNAGKYLNVRSDVSSDWAESYIDKMRLSRAYLVMRMRCYHWRRSGKNRRTVTTWLGHAPIPYASWSETAARPTLDGNLIHMFGRLVIDYNDEQTRNHIEMVKQNFINSNMHRDRLYQFSLLGVVDGLVTDISFSRDGSGIPDSLNSSRFKLMTHLGLSSCFRKKFSENFQDVKFKLHRKISIVAGTLPYATGDIISSPSPIPIPIQQPQIQVGQQVMVAQSDGSQILCSVQMVQQPDGSVQATYVPVRPTVTGTATSPQGVTQGLQGQGGVVDGYNADFQNGVVPSPPPLPSTGSADVGSVGMPMGMNGQNMGIVGMGKSEGSAPDLM